jgi:AGZA family xanthine/uracil permease-like MFS transporter
MSREVRGGLVTFITMAYIVVLNPIIMGPVPDINGHFLGGGTVPNLAAVAAATALVAGIMSILMGLVANYPLALATGLGLNAFLAFVVAQQTSWAQAMGLIVIEGLLTLVLVLTNFRQAVFAIVPLQIKLAIAAGIGVFIAFIGLKDGGIVHTGVGTPVQLGLDGTLSGWPTLVFIVGLVVIVALWALNTKGAILIGIAVSTLMAIVVEAVANVGSQTDATGKVVNPKGWSLNVPKWPDKVFGWPDLGTVGHVSFGAFAAIGVLSAIVLLASLMLSDFFDTMGTMTAIGGEAGLLDEEGNPPKTKQILVVDSVAASAGGLGGVSSATSYIESSSGVGEGARTGLSSVVVGVLFLLAMFFAPLVEIVPFEAATPALVFVGFLMVRQIVPAWEKFEVGFPSFLALILMAFTYSITVGVGAAIVFYALIRLVRRQFGNTPVLLWIVAGVFVIYFALDPLKAWFGIG